MNVIFLVYKKLSERPVQINFENHQVASLETAFSAIYRNEDLGAPGVNQKINGLAKITLPRIKLKLVGTTSTPGVIRQQLALFLKSSTNKNPLVFVERLSDSGQPIVLGGGIVTKCHLKVSPGVQKVKATYQLELEILDTRLVTNVISKIF